MENQYFVVVDRKVIINVQASSRGGAEHQILDLFPYLSPWGTYSCQAFASKEVSVLFELFPEAKTGSLRDVFETLLPYQLKEKEQQLTILQQEINDIKEKIKSIVAGKI